MKSFDSLQRAYDNMLPPWDSTEDFSTCDECRQIRHDDDMHESGVCKPCWREAHDASKTEAG